MLIVTNVCTWISLLLIYKSNFHNTYKVAIKGIKTPFIHRNAVMQIISETFSTSFCSFFEYSTRESLSFLKRKWPEMAKERIALIPRQKNDVSTLHLSSLVQTISLWPIQWAHFHYIRLLLHLVSKSLFWVNFPVLFECFMLPL